MSLVRRFLTITAASTVLAAGSAAADGSRGYEMTITNVTPGQVFSPPVLVTHKRNIALFEVGTPALPELAIVAEDGAGQPLADLLNSLPQVLEAQSTTAPIPPGGSAVYAFNASSKYVLSSVGMLVNTNDAFFALNSVELPRKKGDSFTFSIVAYDAGSEANNEDCAFIPGPACPADSGNARATEGAEGFVAISNGVHGVADLGPVAYDWRNPVARVTVTRVY
ncbi:MAG: spondin domain-containing protein, partial [Pseudomonadota bacterium]